MHLDRFSNPEFDRGASFLVEASWIFIMGILFSTWLPGSSWRVVLLKLYGAKIGRGVVIKPHVKIKFPWKVRIGEHSWIGESVWIDNVAKVSIGNNVCISQGAYLCTGNHNWKSEEFELCAQAIDIEDKVWIGAFSKLAPGITVCEGAVLGLGSVATSDLDSWTIYHGVPALKLRERPQ